MRGRFGRLMTAALFASGLLWGCAAGRPSTIDDVALARLPRGSLEPVNEQRLEVSRANDEMARADTRVHDAEAERDLAHDEQKVATASHDHAQQLIKMGQTERDAGKIDEGKRELDAVMARKAAADAHVAAAEARIDFARAEKAVARQRSDLAQLHLERSKYQALKIANDPVAAKFSDEQYAKAIANEENDLRDADLRVEKAREQFAARSQQWQAKQRRFEAAGPHRPHGG